MVLTVKGRPFLSTLVASCSSSISYKVATFLDSSAIYNHHIVSYPVREGGRRCKQTYNGVLNIGGTELSAVFVDVLHPLVVRLEAVGRQADDLDPAFLEVL